MSQGGCVNSTIRRSCSGLIGDGSLSVRTVRGTSGRRRPWKLAFRSNPSKRHSGYGRTTTTVVVVHCVAEPESASELSRRTRRGVRPQSRRELELSDPVPPEPAAFRRGTTPGALAPKYRFLGPPPASSGVAGTGGEWVEAQHDRFEQGERLEVIGPLSAELAGQRCTLGYPAPHGGHPRAIMVGPQGRVPSGRSFEALGLSVREAEIVGWVTVGDSNAAIAARLHVSLGTVKKHLDKVYAKLGVGGLGALTAFGLDITAP
jgi:DNA-binding CsgD family transcriptional regulator